MTRQTLPNRRPHEIVTFEHAGHRYHAGVGHFPDGRLAEIFINSDKVGSSAAINASDAAIAASLLLQFGCPVDTLRRALTRNTDGSAAGPLGAMLDLLRNAAIAGN
jgi:hypothetical protein